MFRREQTLRTCHNNYTNLDNETNVDAALDWLSNMLGLTDDAVLIYDSDKMKDVP